MDTVPLRESLCRCQILLSESFFLISFSFLVGVLLARNHGKHQVRTRVALVISHRRQKILIATVRAQKFLMTFLYCLLPSQSPPQLSSDIQHVSQENDSSVSLIAGTTRLTFSHGETHTAPLWYITSGPASLCLTFVFPSHTNVLHRSGNKAIKAQSLEFVFKDFPPFTNSELAYGLFAFL